MVELRLRQRHLVVTHPVDVVSHANRNLADAGEHVQLGHEQIRETVHARGVTGQHRVIPAATTLAARVDADLATGGLQELAPLVEQLRRERARTHSRGVRLDDAQHAGDLRRADARTHARAAGRRVRRRHERVRAVVDVEHGRLAALHEDVLALVERRVQLVLRVDDHRAQTIGVAHEVLEDLIRVDRATVVQLDQNLVLLRQRRLDLLEEDGLVENVLHAQADATDLVGVRRADAAARRADRPLAKEPLGDAVQGLVVRGDHVGVAGNAQAGGVRAASLEAVDLIEQRLEIDHATIADDRQRVLRQHAGGQQLQLVLLAADDDRVTGVVAAVGLDHVIHAAAEDVGRLALALVAPLCAHHDDCGHAIHSNKSADKTPG